MDKYSKNNWINIETPPDNQRLVKVKDEFGNEALAEPTYYPFTVEQLRPGRHNSIIHPCEPYWDGGWMILADKGLGSDIKGDIKFWMDVEITEDEPQLPF